MTSPETLTFGPGTFKLGAVGAPLDFSCLVNSMSIATGAATTDPTTKLCGTQRPGVTTLTSQLSGDVDLDVADTDELFRLTSEFAATVQEFRFVPNDAQEREARGQVLILPLDFGGDEFGADMHSAFTWDIVGNIGYYQGGVLLWTQINGPRSAVLPPAPPEKGSAAPGDAFAAEGTITAQDSTNAALLAGLGYVADPLTAWTTGQKILVGPYAFNWSGSAWAAGAHA